MANQQSCDLPPSGSLSSGGRNRGRERTTLFTKSELSSEPLHTRQRPNETFRGGQPRQPAAESWSSDPQARAEVRLSSWAPPAWPVLPTPAPGLPQP